MSGNANFSNGSDHSGESSIDLEAQSLCCGEGCASGCGCNCAVCTGRMNTLIEDENTSNYAGQGGHDQEPVGPHAITIRPANNSLNIGDSFQDIHAVGSNSYEARLPTASPLTRNNIDRLNEQSSGRYSHAKWLAQHYEDVQNNPAPWFTSPVELSGFDVAGAIEGEGMEDSVHSLHVGHDTRSESISMLSHYTVSFSRSSSSPSMFLPDMRRNLVHRPLPLVPECHVMAVDYHHKTHVRPHGNG